MSMSTVAENVEKRHMNENTKTLAFVGAAAALLLAAWMLRPSPVSIETQDDIGQEFFPISRIRWLPRPWKSSSMTTSRAGCALQGRAINGVWSIPSHEGYPADAKNQLEQAAVAYRSEKAIDGFRLAERS